MASRPGTCPTSPASLQHFSFAYGRDSSGTVDKCEEGDPIYIYGSSSYGSPYGKHNEPLTNAYKANINSCPTRSDRRRMVVQ
ncbi:MAG TPA: hypothetical protein VF314_14270 [Actinomycetes bacterium]